jgi:hypothetical protein
VVQDLPPLLLTAVAAVAILTHTEVLVYPVGLVVAAVVLATELL